MFLPMDSVAQWLDSLGLGQYAAAFSENEIGWDVLPHLDHEVLKDVGVRAAGDRVRLLTAIKSLQTASPPAEPVPAGRHEYDTERRQLTVMFADLVGSVELGEQMDIEDYRDLLGQFRQALVSAIERQEGFVARHQGDGLLAYFGYPRASEDAAVRCVRAALDAVRAVQRLAGRYPSAPCVRIGIATGEAVVGDVLATGTSGSSELAVLGPTPNLAAQLQGTAQPNAVVVSETTRQLVSGYFDLDGLPVRRLKGLRDEIRSFQAVSERHFETRFGARTGLHLSQFVGRDEELELLRRRWRNALAGEGRVVVIGGDAGIGKSRLVAELQPYASNQPHTRIHLQCSPYYEASPLHPVIAAFRRVLTASDDVAEGADQLARLANHLSKLTLDEDALGLLADMLSIPTNGGFPLLDALDSQQRRARTLQTLETYLVQQARWQPVLSVFEDVHWADPSTLELLNRLVHIVEEASALNIVTARPGFDPAWRDAPGVTVLNLSRLGRYDGRKLALSVSAGKPVQDEELVESIVSRAGGNPLFIEELMRAVSGGGLEGPMAEEHIPVTLQESLAARLDALSVGRKVAQDASVIGREFELRLLSAIWDDGQELLIQGLEELTEAGLMFG